MFLTAVGVFGACVAQDFVAWILEARYQSAGKLIPLLIAAYLLNCLFWLFQLPLLQEKRARLILMIGCATLAANLALNMWLIPRYGMYGAAYALILAYALQAGATYLCAQRIYFVPYRGRPMLSGLGIFVAVVVLTQFPWTSVVRPLILASGLIVALALLWFVYRRDVGRILAFVRRTSLA